MGNWLGWNFSHSGTEGSGHGELDYVVYDVIITGEAALEGTYTADIHVTSKSGRTVLRSEHIDAATLQAARERAEGLANAANGPAGTAYRASVRKSRTAGGAEVEPGFEMGGE